MSFHYSTKLIQKCQRVFEKRAGRKISDEEAGEILDRLAKIGTLALKVSDKNKSPPPEDFSSSKNIVIRKRKKYGKKNYPP